MINASNDMRFRVYNTCKYDIGIKMINSLEVNIKAGSFALLTVNDILFVQSICPKFISDKMLVPVYEDGKPIPLEEFGIIAQETNNVHHEDYEIETWLKKSVKQIETWIKEIDDPAELHTIYIVAKDMDLPVSKINILKKYIKEKEWLEEDE